MQTIGVYALAASYTCIALGAVLIFTHVGRSIAERHGSDIRIVWYLFSLSLTATLLIAWWATDAGAIDTTGTFHGTRGSLLYKLLIVTLDFETDLKVLGGLSAIVVVPQVMGYLLSSPFGCASAPIFIGPTFRFVFWNVVKLFAVGSGIFLALSGYGWVHDWSGLDARKALQSALLGLAMLVLAFMLLCLYRDTGGTSTLDSAKHFRRLRQIMHRFAAWASRRNTTLPHHTAGRWGTGT